MTEAPGYGPGMYEDFADEFLQHATDSAYNAYYDRPAVLSVLGDVRGLAVLDLGCGPGLYAQELLVRGAGRVVGVDASARMVRLAGERVHGPVTFRHQDLQTPMSWAGDGEFDLALLPLVLHHLDDRVAALREVARVLRRGARLVVSTTHPTNDWLRWGGSHFTVEKVRERWRAGWDVQYWWQPLDVLCDDFSNSGFLIGRIHEPQPSAQIVSVTPRKPNACRSLPASSSSRCSGCRVAHPPIRLGEVPPAPVLLVVAPTSGKQGSPTRGASAADRVDDSAIRGVRVGRRPGRG